MIDQISDYYAKKNSVLIGSESSQTVLASFDSIKKCRRLFSLEKRLKALSSVASSIFLKFKVKVVFNVHLLATEEDFEEQVLRIAQVKRRSFCNLYLLNRQLKTEAQFKSRKSQRLEPLSLRL